MATEGTPASELLPDQLDLPSLRHAAASCQACDLWRTGTQTVFGEGSSRAAVMLVGEQPGDQEDLSGKPFVGPAGKLLDRALQEAGIDRRLVYVTNVVKHFKWTGRGKRRIHEKPNQAEISACSPWIKAEVEVVRPRLIVCLGATAAQAIIGREFRVTKQRGQVMRSTLGPPAVGTVHPSSILRAPDDESREHAFEAFVADLRSVAHQI
jgi:uracil-DNA glycosylase family protein